jgi:cobyric acid synthase
MLGGSSADKSDVALRLAGAKTPKAFVATGQGLDAEMAVRIARHQATRTSDWETAEVPVELAVWGKYIHGVFDQPGFRRAWLNRIRCRKVWPALGLETSEHVTQRRSRSLDRPR